MTNTAVDTAKFPDLMIDLETLSTRSNGCIVSIGYHFADLVKGLSGPKGQIPIEADTENYHVDFGTLRWWMGQSDAARELFTDIDLKRVPIREALQQLTAIVHQHSNPKDLRVWGNGATFDISMTENAYLQEFGSGAPWNHWNVCDVRTLVWVGRLFGTDPKKTLKFEGEPHNAADDAYHQSRYCSGILIDIIPNKEGNP